MIVQAVVFKAGDKATLKRYASVSGAIRAILRKPRTENWEAWDVSGERLQAWIADGRVCRAIASGGFRIIA